MTIGKLTRISLSPGYRLVLEWDDGHEAMIDLTAMVGERRALAALRNAEAFGAARLSDDGWSVEWDCGIDMGAPQLRRLAEEQAGNIMPVAAFRHWIDRHGLTLKSAADALGLSRRTIAYYLSGEQVIPKTVMLATEGYDQRRRAA